jgi:hypothetical protein
MKGFPLRCLKFSFLIKKFVCTTFTIHESHQKPLNTRYQMEIPEIKTSSIEQGESTEKKKIQISNKVAKKIAIKEAIKHLQREGKYVTEIGETVTTVDKRLRFITRCSSSSVKNTNRRGIL